MSTTDLRYYGVPEHEVIMRSIAKKQRWIVTHLSNPEGVKKREASITLLYRLATLANESLREKREKEKP